jgi:hypothetical protein
MQHLQLSDFINSNALLLTKVRNKKLGIWRRLFTNNTSVEQKTE